MPASRYSPSITFSKALIQGMGTAALFAAAQVAADMPTDLESLRALWPALLVGIIAGAVKGAANYWKHNSGGDA